MMSRVKTKFKRTQIVDLQSLYGVDTEAELIKILNRQPGRSLRVNFIKTKIYNFFNL